MTFLRTECFLTGRPLGHYSLLDEIAAFFANPKNAASGIVYQGPAVLYKLPTMRPPREVLLGPPKERPAERKMHETRPIKMETSPAPKGKGAASAKTTGKLKPAKTKKPVLRSKKKEEADEGEDYDALPETPLHTWDEARQENPAKPLELAPDHKLPNFRPSRTWWGVKEGHPSAPFIAAAIEIKEGPKPKGSGLKSAAHSFVSAAKALLASFSPEPEPPISMVVSGWSRGNKKLELG
ncbi:MAG: hypothetical protein PHE27_00700 [Alphaproteobacteria bacterium]|nr:hypothetical protein [Alphaproteobacteria bacterium]